MTDELSADTGPLLGCLYVVATPIGNLDDITLRAVKVLGEVETIAAEDTRHTRKLLAHLGLSGQSLVRLHDHNEEAAVRTVLEVLKTQDVALVSDAGTPLIADPGYRLVRAVWQAGGRVSPIPGASAVMSALAVSPLPIQDFTFAGFLPAKPAARRQRLAELEALTGAILLFEAPHRVLATVVDIAELWPERRLMVAREMTKLHETFLVGTAEALLPALQAEHRGEFVLVLEPREAAQAYAAQALLEGLLPHVPPRAAARITAQLCGGKARDWYDVAVAKRGADA